MPPQKNHSTVSLEEIANWLDLPAERITGYAAKSDLVDSGSDPAEQNLPMRDVGAFIGEIVRGEALNPKSWDVPEAMHTSPHPWERMVAAIYGHPCAYPACLPPSQGRRIREMILERQPRRVLEIGCFMGVSSLWIASALEELGGERHLHSIDLFDPILPWPPHRYGFLAQPETLARTAAYVAGLEHRVTFHRMNSFDLADRYEELIGDPVDFAFIDGDHTIGGCLHDFMTLAARTRIGGALLLHDTNPEFCGWEGPRFVLDRLAIPSANFRVEEIQTEPRNYGMALIEKVGEVGASNPVDALRMASIRWRSKLARSEAWRSIRTTPMGNLIRRVLGR